MTPLADSHAVTTEPAHRAGAGKSVPALSHVALVLSGALAIWLLIALSHGLGFFYDEWEFILDRRLTLHGILAPHNEHFSAVLVFVYRGLVEMVGTDSYTPFLAALWASHLFAATAVYALIREAGSAAQASAASAIFLVAGTGYENLFWAFQIGFVLATGLGCWGMVLISRRPVVASILLTLAVATTGVGLFFLAATAIRAWPNVRSLALPIAVYGAWFLVFGLPALETHDGAFDLASAPAFMGVGLMTAAGSIVAGGTGHGFVITLIRAAGLRAPSRLSLAAIGGLLAMYMLMALVRAQMGADTAASPRYAYVALPFVLTLAMAWWRLMPRRYRTQWIGPALLLIVLVVNVQSLVEGRLTRMLTLAREDGVPIEQRWP